MEFTTKQWPGVDDPKNPGQHPGAATYSEKLLVGYRWYDEHNVTFTTGFPFGHGLSYSTFKYSGIQASSTSVTATVENSGSVAGAEVAQLYLGFPASAGEPPQQLKGFEKVTIKAGAKATVTFALNDRSTSVWDANAHKWTKVAGEFSVAVGGSSRDQGALEGSFSQ